MKVFIGGAWPYANNSLHVGHLAALLPGDVIARYYRKKGDEVIYVSGTDSHGTPITERAKKENVHPSQISLMYHEEFDSCFKNLDFSYDLYTKTSDDYHKKEVQKMFLDIVENGYIYSKTEDQDFCLSCNSFLSDREIEGVCPYCGGLAKGDQCDQCFRTLNAKEINDKHCITCGNKTVQKENTHLYFALSKFQEGLQKLVDKNADNWRLHAITETLKYLKDGMPDRAATRQLSWGVDTPLEGYDDKKIYVWIEAVLGYLTACKKVCEEKGINFEDFIKDSEDLKTYYVHGKDNIPFHTVIFPSLLLAMKKNIKLPDYIISSEYVNVDDEKISKSKGNGVTINDLIKDYTSDTIRYYMISNGPEKKDVNFSYEDLEQRHNKFLVGEYGNFVNRNLAFLAKKFDGVVPSGEMDEEVKDAIIKTYEMVGKNIEAGNLRVAISLIMELVQIANKYYDNERPWIQVKEDINSFNNTTYTCINLMINIANMLEPFIPTSSAKVRNMLGITETSWNYISAPQNIILNNVEVLYNRIDVPKESMKLTRNKK